MRKKIFIISLLFFSTFLFANTIKEYWPNGKLKIKYTLKGDLLHGKYEFYNSFGYLEEEAIYEKGERLSFKRFSDDGKIMKNVTKVFHKWKENKQREVLKTIKKKEDGIIHVTMYDRNDELIRKFSYKKTFTYGSFFNEFYCTLFNEERCKDNNIKEDDLKFKPTIIGKDKYYDRHGNLRKVQSNEKIKDTYFVSTTRFYYINDTKIAINEYFENGIMFKEVYVDNKLVDKKPMYSKATTLFYVNKEFSLEFLFGQSFAQDIEFYFIKNENL